MSHWHAPFCINTPETSKINSLIPKTLPQTGGGGCHNNYYGKRSGGQQLQQGSPTVVVNTMCTMKPVKHIVVLDIRISTMHVLTSFCPSFYIIVKITVILNRSSLFIQNISCV